MRVTGGIYRGRQVQCPPGDIRPSMDRMRQSLFQILGDLSGCAFLDLFSGSGIIAIEAASRGAGPVVLVEKDPRKRATCSQNVSFVEAPVEVLTMPAERFLARDARTFDYVFLDPPFAFAGKEGVLDARGRAPRARWDRDDAPAPGRGARMPNGRASRRSTGGSTGSRCVRVLAEATAGRWRHRIP